MGKFKLWVEIEYDGDESDPIVLKEFPEPIGEFRTLDEAIRQVLFLSDSPEMSYLSNPNVVAEIKQQLKIA
jgi:hypothetical protein